MFAALTPKRNRPRSISEDRTKDPDAAKQYRMSVSSEHRCCPN